MTRELGHHRERSVALGKRRGRLLRIVLIGLVFYAVYVTSMSLLVHQELRSEASPDPAEQQARADLEERGLVMFIDPQTQHVTYLSLGGSRDIDDAVLEKVAALRHLETLNLADSGITDDQLRYVCDLPRLSCLALGGTEISDEGLARLADSLDLTSVYLSNTRISDNSVTHLLRMRNLVVLDLKNTGVSKRGLSRLRTLPKLEVLLYGEEATEKENESEWQERAIEDSPLPLGGGANNSGRRARAWQREARRPDIPQALVVRAGR